MTLCDKKPEHPQRGTLFAQFNIDTIMVIIINHRTVHKLFLMLWSSADKIKHPKHPSLNQNCMQECNFSRPSSLRFGPIVYVCVCVYESEDLCG